MKHFKIVIVMMLGVGVGLGACSSAMDYTSSIGDREVLRIGRAITPKEESSRLIEMLNWTSLNHRSQAIREIEAR